MKYLIIVLVFLTQSFVFSQNELTLVKYPINNQLYPRVVASNLATISIEGEISNSSFTSLSLVVLKDGVAYSSSNFSLSYIGNTAAFNFSTTIEAGSFNYTFRIVSNTSVILKESLNVTAGDVFIIQGQSNATGTTNSDTTTNSHNFIRTFRNNAWQTISSKGSGVGSVAYMFTKNLYEDTNMPILILNGSIGGSTIGMQQRDDSNTTNINTIYGKLLTSFRNAGLKVDDVRGFVYFQGENNSSTTMVDYKILFKKLYNDYEEDYKPEKYYLMQTKACNDTYLTEIPEAQRQIAIENERIVLMSTNGVQNGSDDCHYYDTNGYSLIGERLYNLINHELYGSSTVSGIYPPVFSSIYFTNSSKDQVKIELSSTTDTYALGANLQNFFFLENTSVTVTSVSLSSNIITLDLSGSLTDKLPMLTYVASKNSNESITNQNGIGLVAFKRIPISDLEIVEVVDGNWSYYYYSTDLINPLFGIEKTPTGGNTNNFNSHLAITDFSTTQSSTLDNQGLFLLKKLWNISIDDFTNGTVNIKFFFDASLETDLLNDATSFYNSLPNNKISPFLYTKSNQVYNPINNITHNRFYYEVYKPGTTNTTGFYRGNRYLQMDNVALKTLTGGSMSINVVFDGDDFTRKGAIRYNSTTDKFQGFNGIEWVNFN